MAGIETEMLSVHTYTILYLYHVYGYSVILIVLLAINKKNCKMPFKNAVNNDINKTSVELGMNVYFQLNFITL